ncbi:MAG: formate hydrogenlyase [Deltaproteobacteria bacterium]|nr:formate hydrogenlyase [Deltaproteobacteria bacterium]
MLRILRQIFRTGIVTEPLLAAKEPPMILTHRPCKKEAMRLFSRSVAIRQVDAGSCNGCELEIHAMNNPIYNAEAYGIRFTASPRFADMLLVTGPVARNMEIALKRTYEAVPCLKLVIGVGDCAHDGGIFGQGYGSLGSVGNIIPVDAYIIGCPPEPSRILRGIKETLEALSHM